MLWQLFNLSQTYRVLPSELLGLTNTHAAWQVNRSVAVFGTSLKAELDEVEGKNKREIKRKRDQVLARWFPEARSEKKFKDPGSG